MGKRDVVVLGAARSAIGTFGGALFDIEPSELPRSTPYSKKPPRPATRPTKPSTRRG